MRILFIVPYAPNLVRVRPYQWIRNLTAAGHQVILGTLIAEFKERQDIQNLKEDCEQVVACEIKKARSIFNCLAVLPSQKPLQYVYSWEPKLAKALGEIVLQRANEIDVIHVEHLRGAVYGKYLNELMKKEKLSIPIVWDSVDSLTHLFRQSAKYSKKLTKRWFTYFELFRTEKYESYLAKYFNHVLVTSQKDRDVFLSLTSKTKDLEDEKITVISHGVDLEYFHPIEEDLREANTLVVSGKMSYHANISMALYLIDEIMPLIWAKQPEVKLWIVGKDPDREIIEKGRDPNITVTGMVPDLRPYLQKATIAVAPIVYGAGIQNKVLEAMACGTPVVTSPQALTALTAKPGVELELATNPKEYAEKILILLKHSDERQKLGNAGRLFVEKNHNCADLTKKLVEIYQNQSH
jgi:sugar transferase (PEP-CTERM/EpsH1 system associated)